MDSKLLINTYILVLWGSNFVVKIDMISDIKYISKEKNEKINISKEAPIFSTFLLGFFSFLDGSFSLIYFFPLIIKNKIIKQLINLIIILILL